MQIITTHLNADFDSLAAMVAASRLYPEAQMVFSGSAEPALRDFLEDTDLKERVASPGTIDLSKVDGVILVDTHSADRVGPFEALVNDSDTWVHVYDHHPDGGTENSFQEAVLRKRGACTTVLLEVLKEKNISLNPEDATLMLMGIYEDTHMLTSSGITPEDFEAAADLIRAGGQVEKIPGTIDRPLKADQIALMNDLVSHLEVTQSEGFSLGFVLASAGPYVPDAAVVVSRLLELENLDALFVVLPVDNKVCVIGRSRCPEISVGELLSAFGGGGHAQAGSANITDQTPLQVIDNLKVAVHENALPVHRVSDLMHTPVISISQTEKVARAEKLMTLYNVNTLPVLEKSKPVGLISRQTVEKAIHHKLGRDPVNQIMTHEFSCVRPEEPFQSVVPLLIENRQKLVPVVHGTKGTLAGIITRGDLLGRMQTGWSPLKEGFASGAPQTKRIKSLMKERLPARYMDLFNTVAELANRQNVMVYAVGGFVRDLLLEKVSQDIDLVVEGEGIPFAKKLSRALEGKLTVHPTFGTSVLTLSEDLHLDVATARAEFYHQPAALPTVEPGSVKLDLLRRDFTLNSMAIRLNGPEAFTLLDHFNGQRDLKDKKIRVLHNLSFVEDPTRAFRAVRFEQRFGFRMGRQTEMFLKHAVKKNWINRLSGHRLFNEMKSILREKNPVPAIQRMKELGLLQSIHTGLLKKSKELEYLENVAKTASLKHLVHLSREVELWRVYLLVLFYGLDTAGFRKVARRLDIGKKLQSLLAGDLSLCREILKGLRRKTNPKPGFLYDLLTPCSAECLFLILSVSGNDRINKWVVLYLTQYQETASLCLKGEDLIGMGLKPGPVFQKVFKVLRNARLDGQISTRQEEEALVRQKFFK